MKMTLSATIGLKALTITAHAGCRLGAAFHAIRLRGNPAGPRAAGAPWIGAKAVLAAASLLAGAGYGPLLEAAPAQLLSARDPSAPLSAGGNDESVAAVLSPDGRFVVFLSAANDLVPGDNNQPGFDVFLRDRASNTVVLVSASCSGAGGGNGSSIFGQVSSNGQFVVFQSDASDLVPGDTNNCSDIFVRDLAAGTTRLVSVAVDGGSANGASFEPVMTPDGRYVAFISSARNLVAGDTNGIADVFVRDLESNTTFLVSIGAVRPSGATTVSMGMPAITPDGRYVAFFSSAQGLASGIPPVPNGEVYLRDQVTGQTTWASTNAAAILLTNLGQTSIVSYHPVPSADGRYIAFKSGSVAATGAVAILRYDCASGTTAIVSTNGFPALLDQDDPFGPEMTPEGRYVAFVRSEDSSGLGYSSVRVWDAQTGQTALASDNGGEVSSNTFSRSPLISPDGRFVTFLSNATNLVANPVTSGFHIYLRDLQLGAMRLVDVDLNGAGSTDEELTSLSLSADGRFVVFSSPDGNLVNQDNNRFTDVFVRDTVGSATELISKRDPAIVPRSAGTVVTYLKCPSAQMAALWLFPAKPTTWCQTTRIMCRMSIFMI
jgi:Tol biopolymer transport system component